MLMVTIIQIGSNLHHTALHIVSSSSRVARQRGCRGSRRASSGDDSTDDVARSHGVAVQRASCWRLHLVVRHRVAVLVILGNGRHADLSKRRERKLRRRLDDARHGHARDGSRRERSRRSEAKDSEEVAEHFCYLQTGASANEAVIVQKEHKAVRGSVREAALGSQAAVAQAA